MRYFPVGRVPAGGVLNDRLLFEINLLYCQDLRVGPRLGVPGPAPAARRTRHEFRRTLGGRRGGDVTGWHPIRFIAAAATASRGDETSPGLPEAVGAAIGGHSARFTEPHPPTQTRCLPITTRASGGDETAL
jgi:hypothetical protein